MVAGLWSILFGWIFVGIAVPVLIGAGISVMSMNPSQYALAQGFFTIAALGLFLRTSWWLAFEQPLSRSWQGIAIFSFLTLGSIGALWVQSIRWVEGLRPLQSPLKARVAPGLTVTGESAPGALNLVFHSEITLPEVSLMLTDLKRASRRRFIRAQSFAGCHLNGARLPIFSGGEEVRYQLVDCQIPQTPVICCASGSRWPLPSPGVWQADLEFRSTGNNPIQLLRCFKWNGRASPSFTECPQLGKAPGSIK